MTDSNGEKTRTATVWAVTDTFPMFYQFYPTNRYFHLAIL